jgi:Flp pilus assembly protein TadB
MDILKAIGLAKEYRTIMEYAQLKEYFRYKIGKNFKKGTIDDEEIDLYFGFGFREEGLPVGQLHVENKRSTNGMTNIRVHLATYWIVLLIVIPLAMLIGMLLTGFPTEIAIPFILCGYLLYYLSSYFLFERQFKKFIEMFQESETRYR